MVDLYYITTTDKYPEKHMMSSGFGAFSRFLKKDAVKTAFNKPSAGRADLRRGKARKYYFSGLY
jgi:hypothetical protein